jgi:threonine dehydratase
MTSRTLNHILNTEVFFKCENFQRIGAFKARGAFNTIKLITNEDESAKIITHSSGNHAQAVALASRELGVDATVVMPQNAPIIKKEATRGYGATIVECGNNPEDRAKTTQELIDSHGYILVHPYNDLRIIHGASTAAYELLNEIGKLDFVLTPVGGGGLLSGTALCIKSFSPGTSVIGVEPLNANDAYLSFKDGIQIFPSVNPNTIADGLRTSLGNITFKIIKKNVDDIILVTEKEILNAMQFLWERMKLVIEPSGAVPLAGLFKLATGDMKELYENRRIGLILSGGNIDLSEFFTLLSSKIENS